MQLPAPESVHTFVRLESKAYIVTGSYYASAHLGGRRHYVFLLSVHSKIVQALSPEPVEGFQQNCTQAFSTRHR